jgi:tRNA pseudouridine13 synthase
MEIHPTGPLPGRAGRALEPGAEAWQREREWLAPDDDWVQGLIRLGVEAERRALRLPVRELTWRLDSGVLELGFELPAGGYATTVLRECVAVSALPAESA